MNSQPTIKTAETQTPTPKTGLLALIGAGERDFASSEAVDAFLKAERATWGKTWSS